MIIGKQMNKTNIIENLRNYINNGIKFNGSDGMFSFQELKDILEYIEELEEENSNLRLKTLLVNREKLDVYFKTNKLK